MILKKEKILLMKNSSLFSAMSLLMVIGLITRCDNSSPNNPQTRVLPGKVILSEGFEGNLENYNQVTYHPEDGKMSISTQYAHSGKGSLTSDSNYTGIKTRIDPALDDSIAGVQFYLMATKASQTNLLVAICKPGSSASGLFTIIGMGIDKSDSLKYVYESAPGDSANSVYKNFAALTFNKWYKCKIEYDFPNSNLIFYLDDGIVHQQKTENPLFLSYFAAMRDGLGAKGPSGYYIDDLAIYNYKK